MVPAAAPSAGNSARADYAAYSAAWANQKKGEFAKAAEWYRLLIDKLPQSSLVPSARVKVGECYFSLKEYKRAIDELAEARTKIDSAALRGDADYIIAESYYNLNDFENAAGRYESFLKEYPAHRLVNEVQYALAWSYFKSRRFAEAADAFGKIPSGDPQLARAAAYRKGVAEKLAGNRSGALATFQKVYQNDPQSDYADNAMSVCAADTKLGRRHEFWPRATGLPCNNPQGRWSGGYSFTATWNCSILPSGIS